MLAQTLPRRMQADHVALIQHLLQAYIITALSCLARRIADQNTPAQATQHLKQTTANLPRADNAISTASQINALLLGQYQQAAQHIVDHATGIAARRAGPGDASLLEVIEVQMIGTNGTSADKLHWRAAQQRAINLSHRTHQQQVSIGDRSRIDTAAGQATNLAKTGKEFIKQGNVFVGDYLHGFAPQIRPAF